MKKDRHYWFEKATCIMYCAEYFSFRFIRIQWNWKVNLTAFHVNISFMPLFYLQTSIPVENCYHQYQLFQFSEIKPTSVDVKCPFHWRHLNWNVVTTETNETTSRNISANGNKYIEFRRCQIHLYIAIIQWHKSTYWI